MLASPFYHHLHIVIGHQDRSQTAPHHGVVIYHYLVTQNREDLGSTMLMAKCCHDTDLIAG
jgi:hypothetical protein